MRTLPAMGMTRGGKLTEEKFDLCLELAGKGAPNGTVAAAIGIHVDTLQNWLRWGREEIEKIPEDAEEGDVELSKYARLFLEMNQTRANLEANLSQIVVNTALSGAPNTWQAAMTWLERRNPAEWGKRETRIHEGETPSGLPAINILVLNDTDARETHRDVLRRLDAANRSRTGIASRPGVGGELESGSDERRDDLIVDPS